MDSATGRLEQAGPEVSRPRGSLRVCLALSAGALVFALSGVAAAGEILVRIREEHRLTVPGSEPTLYYRHARLGTALVRGGHYFSWTHVNAQGFRGGRPTSRTPVAPLRIMTLGASTTFDSFVSRDASAWPAVLERDLKAQGLDAEVVNAGTPGYQLLDNLIRWHTELASYHPNLLIVYHGHNELLAALRGAARSGDGFNPRPGAVRSIAPWTLWLERHSLLYNKLQAHRLAASWVSGGRRQQQRQAITRAGWDSIVNRAAARYARELETFLRVVAVDSVPVVLLDMAHVSAPDAATEGDTLARRAWQATVPTAPVEVVLAAYRAFNEVTVRQARAAGVPVIRISAFGLIGTACYSPGDPIHFNDAGAARMAEGLAKVLARRLAAGSPAS